MRILVIGGFGHIGRFLVPKLVHDGHEVIVATRGRQAKPDAKTWATLTVRHIATDYDTLTQPNRGASILADLAPDAVVDILGRGAPGLADALPDTVRHLVICGSLWMFGPASQVPTPEIAQAPCPFEVYRTRFEQLQMLLGQSSDRAITGVMPSNIAGPGKIPIDPHGGRDIAVHKAMAAGQPMVLPGDGKTLVGPTDADDVAQVFRLALLHRDKAAGRLFNVAAAYAISFNKLMSVYGETYGKSLPITYLDFAAFEKQFHADESALYHHREHMCGDITQARTQLGYEPAHTPEQAIARAVDWMRQEKLL